MKRMKKALAVLLAVGLLAEAFFTGVGISGVQAAEEKKTDTTAPIITSMKLKSSSPIKRTGQVELEVAYKEEGTGVNAISGIFYDEETFSMVQINWEVGEEEKGRYVGSGSVTIKSDKSEKMDSGHYRCLLIAISDFNENAILYVEDESGKNLLGYDAESEDDEVINEIKNVSFYVCNKHSYQNVMTKATTKKNGSIKEQCQYCRHVKSKETIYYPKTISLSTTSYTYDGKTKKPTITVKDSNGKKISSSNYTVTWSSGRKDVGEYSAKIKFKGNYTGTVTKTFKILPKATSLTKVTAGTKSFTAKWKKQSTQTSGYQISYATNSAFTSAKSKTFSGSSTLSGNVTKLSAKKTYYVRVRTYKTVKVNGSTKKIYSNWSTAKKVTTK